MTTEALTPERIDAIRLRVGKRDDSMHFSDVSDLLDEAERLQADSKRMDTAQALFFGADFDFRDADGMKRRIVMLRLPDGVRIGPDFRAFLDAASLTLQAKGEDHG